MVVVDDIWQWESWEIIRRALPTGNRLCRIIATTRVHAIADKCCHTEEGTTMFVQSGIDHISASGLSKKILDENKLLLGHWRLQDKLCRVIAYICGGMTLAVRCLSSAAAVSGKSFTNEHLHLETLWEVLLDGLLDNNPELRPMVESLRLGYDDLPVHVKTCLLYCSIFPNRYKIARHGLVRKWITLGFLPRGPEQDKEAEAWLDELVSRGLLQQDSASSSSYCSVHPMMRAFLLWKSREANFATCLELPLTPPSYASAPMLFVGIDANPDCHDEAMLLSRARCLVIHDECTSNWQWGPRDEIPWEHLKRVRVLSIENERYRRIRIDDLIAICGPMIRLRHLCIKGKEIGGLPQQIGSLYLQRLETLEVSKTAVTEIPKEIGRLHHMKILDVSNTNIWKLPREIGKLQHLKTLDVSNTNVREVPTEIEELQQLETLDVSNTNILKLPREIGKLQHLKTLDVSNTNVQDLPWLFSSSVSVLVGGGPVMFSDGVLAIKQAWNNHTISPSVLNPGKDLSIMLRDCSNQLLPVAGLKVRSGHMMGVPEWVEQHVPNDSSLDIRLCKLNQDYLDFLRNKMQNLQLLTVRLEVLPRKPIVITGEGFSMLKSFCLDCRLPMATFQQGAMPKLEHLEFKFYTSRALTCDDPVGIRHLRSLKRVVFRSSPRYNSDAPGISMVIDKVREEAKEHPNKITISINGKDEAVIREKEAARTTTSASNRVSEENIVTGGGASGSNAVSMIETVLPICYKNCSDDDKGIIVPVKSYYPFGVTE